MVVRTILIGFVLFVRPLTAAEGIIEGVVLNATRNQEVSSGTEVVLRALFNGKFVSLAQTVTQSDGSFRFAGLPLDGAGPYLPGANQGDVHFPGPRVVLSANRPNANVTLAVFESASRPNPLVIENHEILVHVEPGSIKVRETMVIDNPSSHCYVGSPRHAGGGPVTLQLGIPVNFERITFDKEVFGRHFSLINEELVTGIPWPPGKRELGFSYVIANDQNNHTWQRRVDLPCSSVNVIVHANHPDQVTCNLPVRSAAQDGKASFASSDGPLPAGYLVQLDLDSLPVSTMVYARWIALLILLLLIVAISSISIRRRSNVAYREKSRATKKGGGLSQSGR